MDFYDAFEAQLFSALDVMGDLSGEQGNPRVLYLARLLRNVVANLQAILADLESGCSWGEMGFSDDSEVNDVLDGFALEISTLKSLIQNARMFGVSVSV